MTISTDIIWRVYQNAQRLMKSRGVSEAHLPTMLHVQVIEGLIESFTQNKCTLDLFAPKADGGRVYVHMIYKLDDNSSKMPDTLVRANELDTQKDDVVLIYFQVDKPLNAKKMIDIQNKYTWLNVLTYKKMLIHLPDHELIPPHERLSKDIIPQLKKDLMIYHLNQLPLIYHSDPVCQHYGFRPGDVIKVTRRAMGNRFATQIKDWEHAMGAYQHPVYRFVVKGGFGPEFQTKGGDTEEFNSFDNLGSDEV